MILSRTSGNSVHGTDPRDNCRRGLHPDGLTFGNGSAFVECYYRERETPESCRARSCAGDAHIAEIHQLGNTVNLAQRRWSFAHFVPEIVRRVLDNSTQARRRQTGDHAGLHGCQGFTTSRICRSRRTDAATSRHLVLTQAFLAEGGTIDKFIGDAVMVFWNAPNPQPDHVARACRAVLAAQAAAQRLNAEFEVEGWKPFITRFGIHVGEAVVGNVGSTERMNYTALGNAVNLAARLEGLNKEVGTTILASEDVYLRVHDQFEFRAYEAVVAKGMSKETRIYGLVGVLA